MLAWLTEKYVLAPKVRGGVAEVDRDANEAAAVLTMGEIGLAELQYQVAHPETGFACSLAALGLPANVAMGHRNGYAFAISACDVRLLDGEEIHTGYRITAMPEQGGQTGQRGFCADESRTVTVDPEGGTNCTEGLR